MSDDDATEALRALLGDMPESVAIYDLDGRVVWMNAATERLFGTSLDALRGKRLFEDVFPRAVGNPFHQAFRRVAESGATEVLDHYYAPFDAWFANRISRVGARVHVVARDVTDEMRRRDEAARIEDERRRVERNATRRLESLLELTTKLARVETVEEIARVLVDEGVDALDASIAGMYVLGDDADLVLVRERGFTPAILAAFNRVPTAAPGPIGDCVRLAKPVFLESRAEYAARYPAHESTHRPEAAAPIAFAILPFVIEGRAVGCVNFAFNDERRLSTDERTYLEVLASHGAEALRRVRLYAELRDAGETRQAMIDASPAAIMLLDDRGCVLTWNEAAERIFGWAADEVIGRYVPFVDHRKEEFELNLSHVHSGGVVHARETRRMRKDGEWIDVELYAAPVRRSDGRMFALAMFFDIRARKRVERGRELIASSGIALSRSLDTLSTLKEVVQLVTAQLADFCVIDRLSADGEWLERLVVSAEEVAPGVAFGDRLKHDPARGGSSAAIASGRPHFMADLDDKMRDHLARDAAHMSLLRASGIRAILSVPLVAKDHVLGALSIASRTRNFDVLDLEIATELAERIALALENARLFQESTAARREAEAASRAKDEFVAMLGHELRNPLSPIVTALDLMRMRAPNVLERERAVIERQVAHVSRLVDDLLDVSRITRGKVELRRERVSIASAVAKAIEITSPLFETRRHELAMEVPEHLVVDADPTRLSQVIANLLSNAAKYTPPGGHVRVEAAQEADVVTLTVRDDGVGIVADMLPRVFDTFVQAPQTSARTDGGLGLGLTIVRSLVEAHGGSVVAKSEGAGRGTTMVVRLPAAAPAASNVAEGRPVSSRSVPSARRVLVVDDNEDAAELLAEVLGAHGHEIRTAFDGPSALSLAEQFDPHVAVLDIGLPVMDGYELAERLRASERFAGLRLIAVTGYGQESDRARAKQAGFDAHIAKPVAINTLVDLVARARI